MRQQVRIRAARPEDAPALLEIYAPYVRNTAITFEYDVPTPEAFAGRVEKTLQSYPYLLAEDSGRIVGYAYAGAFHVRAAYGWSVETSVYLRTDCRRRGVGRALYTALEAVLAMQGVLNCNACIACPEVEDEYLTRDSIAFHEKMGYQTVGRFHQCGRKFGRWYDMVWMEKLLAAHTETAPERQSFDAVRSRACRELDIR